VAERTLVIHAGTRKTGTTAIQDYFFHHFDHPEFAYFSAGIPNASMIINRSFAARRPGVLGNDSGFIARISRGLARRRARNRFMACLAKHRGKNVILSAESISSLTQAECADLYEVVSRQFEQVKVIIYFRPARSRMESAYQETLKHRLVNIDKPVTVNFKQSVRKFDKVFGRKNVTLRLFSPTDFPDRNVVNDFLSLVGIEGNVVPSMRSNSSLSLPAVQLLYVYRKAFPVAVSQDKALLKKLAELEGEKFQLHPNLMDNVVNEENANYDWFEKRAGFSLKASPAREGVMVSGESDLLDVSAKALQWLSSQLGDQFSGTLVAEDHSRIAAGMRQLALSIESESVKLEDSD
jgi:hypothetical protein